MSENLRLWVTVGRLALQLNGAAFVHSLGDGHLVEVFAQICNKIPNFVCCLSLVIVLIPKIRGKICQDKTVAG